MKLYKQGPCNSLFLGDTKICDLQKSENQELLILLLKPLIWVTLFLKEVDVTVLMILLYVFISNGDEKLKFYIFKTSKIFYFSIILAIEKFVNCKSMNYKFLKCEDLLYVVVFK